MSRFVEGVRLLASRHNQLNSVATEQSYGRLVLYGEV